MRFEEDYLDLLQSCIKYGHTIKNDRTGVGTRRLIGKTVRATNIDLEFPMLTTRPVAFKIAFWETMMFLRGINDSKFLEEKGINIWKGNTTREFLDKRGLSGLPEGHMGYGYSHNWRNFGGSIHANDENPIGVDQIKNLLEGLAANPNDRRHLVTAWDPNTVEAAALPPCHVLQQYFMTQVDENRFDLDSTFYMRSSDLPFGLPYNMMSYALLNIIFAKHLSDKLGIQVLPYSVTYMGGDCHIYSNQLDMVNEQLTRTPTQSPRIEIQKNLANIDDVFDLDISDVIFTMPYKSQPKIASTPRMAV